MNGNIMQLINEPKWEDFSEEQLLHQKEICDEVNSYKPNLVIDVGCGSFWSKSKIKNVIGFDKNIWTRDQIVFSSLDLLCTIKEADKIFTSNCADIVMCLGSLHRNNEAKILSDFNIVSGWASKFLVMRAEWSNEFIYQITEKYDLLIDSEIKTGFPTSNKKYWWWKIK